MDLGDQTSQVLALIAPLARAKKLELKNLIPEDLPPVLADEERLQQILHNLIGNAVKFTSTGSIEVTASCVEKRVRIQVSDTGIGIEESDRKRIFLSFEQAKDSIHQARGGTGLGLAISSRLVELHGCVLELESIPGEGSSFSFSLEKTSDEPVAKPASLLPLLPVTVSHIAAVEPLPPEGAPFQFHILVVDDDPINRQVLYNHLTLFGHRIAQAADGEQALTALNEQRFDLVLLDVMMPGLTGYQVCRRLRHKFPIHHLPVIFLTAKNQSDDMAQSYLSGGNDYLTKPVSGTKLFHRISVQLRLLQSSRDLAESHEEILANNQELIAKNKEIRLGEQQKMDALKTLTAGVAHEVNNAANMTHGNLVNLNSSLKAFQTFLVNLAGEDAEPEILDAFKTRLEPIFKLSQSANEGLDRARSVVSDLFRFSQLNRGLVYKVPLIENIDAAMHLVQPSYKESIQFHTEYADSLELTCHPIELSQVFFYIIVTLLSQKPHKIH